MPRRLRVAKARWSRLGFFEKWALLTGARRQAQISEDQLRRLWEDHGEEVEDFYRERSMPARRPWAWWVFVRGVDPPDEWAGAVWLAEHDQLEDWEVAAIKRRATDDDRWAPVLRIITAHQRAARNGG